MGAEHRYLPDLLSEEHPELDLKDDSIHPTPTPQCGDLCASSPQQYNSWPPQRAQSCCKVWGYRLHVKLLWKEKPGGGGARL